MTCMKINYFLRLISYILNLTMIKKYLKNIIFAILGNALVAELIYFLTIKKTNKLYVINYHKTYYKHSENFKKQLIYLKKKFQIIDENYLLNFFYTKKKLTNKPKLLITFDDGHISNYIVASKILDNLNIKGIFFIPTEYINRTNIMFSIRLKDIKI